MPKRCTVCTSKDRPAIEQAVREGEPYRVTAIEYRVSYSALQRHIAHHMAAEDTVQEGVKLKLEDVMDIPANMTDRRDLVKVLVDKSLEPLWTPGSTVDDLPHSFLIGLFRLQQNDEQTVLRVNGLLRGNLKGGKKGAKVDAKTAEVREQFRQMLDPTPEADAAFHLDQDALFAALDAMLKPNKDSAEEAHPNADS
jgi:hypothetical protein